MQHKVDNLISTIDWNGLQIDGPNDSVITLGDLPAKWKAFGWEVLVLENGNDVEAVINTLQLAQTKTGKGKPVMVLMKTVMGKGVDFMENNHNWHGVAPDDAQLAKALAQLEETVGDY